MRLALQSRKRNVKDNRYDKATDFFESNIGVSL